MNLLEKTDKEILEIAEPMWDDLVESSNKRDYLGFIKHFSKEMLMGPMKLRLVSNGLRIKYFPVCPLRESFWDASEEGVYNYPLQAN